MKVTLNGSCLCGEVCYAVTGEPQRFYHCHCTRCRKSSGAGHASNLIITGAQLIFSRGESLLKRYKVVKAKRFARQFCNNCGAAVARFVPELDAVVVPAGSLDCEAPTKPQARIFWDSRAEWSCDGDKLPRYAEYPSIAQDPGR
ncbi:GFA family protein [Candidatus Methylospira mobilis]|uniref:GFA family protein n=1 Tax=Candidatus Methylospira mobilis TaxID=1808979 RepID=A0A5Q0BDI3_9GAMM|nr:GFA family protein [Candidatus Methylospira mobilis]QFY41589.1 GFA family protein [Candidatus Methylospira mobilis]WNV05168.1 GFA family protein [Candidatus Methylospira mobilis]